MLPVSLKKVLVRILSTPMVLETGTDGIWTYRKWSDGTAECWGKISTTYTNSKGWGGGKYMDFGTKTFPTNLFTAQPILTAIANKPNGSGMPFFSALGVSSTGFNGYIYDDNVNQTGYTVEVMVYAVGKWATLDPSTQTMTISTISLDQMTKAEIQALIEASGNQFKNNDIWIPSNLT